MWWSAQQIKRLVVKFIMEGSEFIACTGIWPGAGNSGIATDVPPRNLVLVSPWFLHWCWIFISPSPHWWFNKRGSSETSYHPIMGRNNTYLVQSVSVVKMDLSPTSERYFCCVVGENLAQAGYTKWAFMEPTNFPGEDCGGINSNTELVDISCYTPYPFVCEFET